MIFWNLSQAVPICAVPTLGGFVYAAKTSPIDPGKLLYPMILVAECMFLTRPSVSQSVNQ